MAQNNVVVRLEAAKAPADAIPGDTYLEERRRKFHNGELVELFYEPNAITDGDSIVHFRRSDVIAAGDIFNTTQYPFIDLKNGGSVQGEINALDDILSRTGYEHDEQGGTYVIPGHGYLCDEHEVVEYRDMVAIVRDRVQAMIKTGATLDQVKAAGLTADYDTRYGVNSSPGPPPCLSRPFTTASNSRRPRRRQTRTPRSNHQTSSPMARYFSIKLCLHSPAAIVRFQGFGAPFQRGIRSKPDSEMISRMPPGTSSSSKHDERRGLFGVVHARLHGQWMAAKGQPSHQFDAIHQNLEGRAGVGLLEPRDLGVNPGRRNLSRQPRPFGENRRTPRRTRQPKLRGVADGLPYAFARGAQDNTLLDAICIQAQPDGCLFIPSRKAGGEIRSQVRNSRERAGRRPAVLHRSSQRRGVVKAVMQPVRRAEEHRASFAGVVATTTT